MKGKFITFEGSEGCGKSTQSRLLYQYLKRIGHDVIYLREPGSTRVGEKIRKILLDAKNDSMAPVAEMLLYMAARGQVVKETIGPALRQGKIVICDRFLDSTLAYQGYGLGMDINMIRAVGKFITQGVNPDLTILLDLAPHKGFKYHDLRKDRIEQRSTGYHARVRKGYLKLAKLEARRFRVIQGLDSKAQIQEKIREQVCRFLK